MDFSRRRNVSRLEGPSSTMIEVSARDISLTIFCDPPSGTERSDRLQEAFDAYKTHAIGETRWMNVDEIKEFQTQSQNQPVHYVCDPFEGPAFDLVRDSDSPVWGPLVLLRCLRDKRALPICQKGQGIYSQAMKDVVATFSSVTPTRRVALTERIRWMGGRVEAALNNAVTHVITDEVGSKKYIVGSQRGLALQTTAWVDQVWNVTQHELKHALSVAEEFRTPIFSNLTITTSGLAEEEKSQVSKLTQENGGSYTGKLTKANTHLVIREAKGAKYTAALKWQLHLVSPDWIFDSVAKGFMIDPVQYRIGNPAQPVVGDDHAMMNSSITSVASTVSRSVLSERTTNVSAGSGSGDPAYSEVLRLTKEAVSSAGQFLDGCSVHVFGVRDKALLDRLHQLINQAGGLREDAFNEGVTHIITIPSASGLSELQRNIEASFASPAVILPSWLAACVREKRLVSPGAFAVPGFDPPPDAADNMNETHGENTIQSATCLSSSINPDRTCGSISSVKSKHPAPGRSGGAILSGCLAGKAFFLTQELRTMFLNTIHDLPVLREGIESLGGGLVDSENSDDRGKYQDIYSVYTNMVSATTPSPNAITILHLESVIKERRWIDPMTSPFFQVIHAPKSDVPNGALSNVVVTPTGFSEQEVISMTRVLALFGASLQAVMVRNSKPDKELWATTHLVCATDRMNSKLEAAKRWKLPAVKLDWILSCAREARRVGVKDYLIDPAQWEALPDAVKKSPRKPPPETPAEKKKRPIEFQLTPSQGPTKTTNDTPTASTNTTVTPRTSSVFNDNGDAAVSGRRPSEAQTPVLSSQRMREIIEECNRFKTPKRSSSVDTDSPGLPRIDRDKIAEMLQQIQDSPLPPYEIPEASFSEKCSQARSAKACLSAGRPLEGIVAVVDDEGLKCSLELKMSIERLGGWVCYTVERCTVVILPPMAEQSDDARRLRVRAQKLNKPIVGVEWIWAAIDTMERPAFADFPPDYEEKHGGPYVRKKTLKDYVPKWDDSDLDISGANIGSTSRRTSMAETVNKKDESDMPLATESDKSMPIVEQPSVDNIRASPYHSPGATGSHDEDEIDEKSIVSDINTPEAAAGKRSLRPRRPSVASTPSGASEVPHSLMETPQPDTSVKSTTSSLLNDPLQDILRRSVGRQSTLRARRLSRAAKEEQMRAQLEAAEPDLDNDTSVNSVLKIETQPEGEITYGGKTIIPTSTQLNSTLNGDGVGPNFGDVSVVRPHGQELMGPPAIPRAAPKRSLNSFEGPQTPGKKFKKNPVRPELCLDDTSDVLPPPSLSKKPTDRLYELYHLDEETHNRCRHLITELGGTVMDELSGDESSSSDIERIIIVDATQQRVMKKSSLLQQLARGGWVLGPSYVDDSSAAGCFLPEAEYMLGIGSKGQPPANIRRSASERFACWSRWRQQRLEHGTGAFDGWKVGLFSATPERERGHRRLLRAGGALVLDHEDLDTLKEATHIFVTKGDTNTAKKLRAELGPDVIIVAPEYMLHHLSFGEVDPTAFEIK